jgi:hypothetical protein
MPDQPLTNEEGQVLAAVMAPGATVHDRTLGRVAKAAGLEMLVARRVLRGLEERQPHLVLSLVDENENVRFWISTPEAAEAMEDA